MPTPRDRLWLWQHLAQRFQRGASVEDFLASVSRTGMWDNKPARIYNVLGRREGSASTPFVSGGLTDVTEFPMTNGVYPELAGTEALELVSTSASDAAAGTGARTVEVTYLDTNYDLQQVTITMNGTTPVSLGAVRARAIWWMHNLTVGSVGTAVGTIDLRTTTGAVVHERIAAAGNQSLSARIKVPRNHTAYVIDFHPANGSNTVTQDVRLRTTTDRDDNTRVDDVYMFKMISLLGFNQSEFLPLAYLKVPELADIKASTASSATNSGRVSVSYTVVVREN